VQTTKTIPVALVFEGTGVVVEHPSGTFRGGVPDPEPGEHFGFNVRSTEPDEDGIWNPSPRADTLEGGLQINLWGNSHALRELGRYLLALAELDTTADPDFHQHHELTSTDGRTHLHLIVRKVQM
jgi:hypothetical protein